MITRIRLPIALLLTVSFLGAHEALGQSTEKGWGIPGQPLNCEMNLQNLDYLAGLLREQMKETGFLIILARLGKGEMQPRLNYRRLYNVRLKLTLIDVPKDRIIVGEGEPANGFGRIEFYLRGELVGALLVHKQSDICVGCCDPDERFYPYKERFRPKPKQRRRVT